MNYKNKDIFVDNKLVAIHFIYLNKKNVGINFLTKSSMNFQIGLMSHKKNHVIKSHYHLIKKKIIKNTSELLIIFKGRLKVFFYNKLKKIKQIIILKKKDMLLINSGTHGFKVLENIEMLEVKQGPFFLNKNKKLI